MIDDKKTENVEAFNYERCDQEMLAKRSDEWQDIEEHTDEKKIKMCNSYYGLIAVKDDDEK